MIISTLCFLMVQQIPISLIRGSESTEECRTGKEGKADHEIQRNPYRCKRLYRKFYRMIETGNRFPFLAYYKQRRLIIRSDFEKYLEMHPDLKEGLKNGRAPIPKKKRLEAPSSAKRRIDQG